MLGTVVNVIAIIVGSFFGNLFRGGIPQKYNETIIKSLGLCVVLIGIINALKVQNLMLVIFSMVLGSLAGEFIRIEDKLENLGKWLENKFSGKGNGIAQGFVTASLVYCVGSMAIVGSMESGLTGNHQTLFAKSILDGVSAIIFTSTMGIGVMFSAIPVFLYQGLITITASFMKQFLIDAVITDMSAVGGLLIVAIGLNLLKIEKIKVGNMLPAIFVPLLYYIFKLAINIF